MSYSTVLSACARGGAPPVTALALLDRMRARGIAPNDVTFGAAIAACAAEPRRAVALLIEVRSGRRRIGTFSLDSHRERNCKGRALRIEVATYY